tara:strand:+ start:15699 stop:16001 length:303 start_codon:yes stop_codon:yes gene_type:complete
MAHPLIGKPVGFQGGGKRIGFFCGIVRKVTMTRATKARPATVKSIVVQRIGGEQANSGRSYSARCGGERIRMTLEDLTGVSWFGKMRPVQDFLEKGTLGS